MRPPTSPPTTGAGMAERLRLDRAGADAYRRAGHDTERHLFGGLLLAQALRAAADTVDPRRRAHSVHGHFLAAGDGRADVVYQVERTRDGASFSSRRVSAVQGTAVLFVATASFQVPEPGAGYEMPRPPLTPDPETLPVGRYDSPWFDSRDVPPEADGPDGDGGRPHSRRAWFKARAPLPDDAALHIQAIVYLTDHGATRAVRQPHAGHPRIEDRMSVTLNHAVWLHGPARADQWLLSEFHPVATGAGRGLAAGTIWTGDGRLVATVTQEALLRLPPG